MEELKELIHQISPQKTQKICIIGDSEFKKDWKSQKLYFSVLNNEINTDTEGTLLIYGSIDKRPHFLRLKSKLKERLYNSAFFIDISQKKYKGYREAFNNCHRQLALIFILRAKGARRLTQKLATRLLKTSVSFEITHVTLECLDFLASHYSYTDASQKKYKFYRKRAEFHRCVSLSEKKCEIMHTDLINKIIADNKLNETLDLAIFQDKLLSSHFQNYPTVKNTYYYYFNKIYIAESTNDLKLLKSTCEEALEHFYNKPFRFTTGIHSFGSNLLNVLIKLKEYNEGREKFYDLLNNTIHGSNHWFVAINLYTYLCFRSKKYNEGLTWHTKAIKNRRLKLQPSVDQEKFKVFGIYYSYLKMINEITSPNSIQANKSPRIAKFLNEVPTLSKDYKGARVAILLIQISFQLLKKEHQNLISTVDGLKRYRRRYLRDKNSVRSNIFLQMVAKLIENDFDREKAIAKTKSLRARLANHPIESVNQPFGVEILPYEEHWNLLLANLD